MEQHPYRAVGVALEVIPRTLAQNCGANVIRTLTKLRAKHADSTDCTFGLNGHTGEIVDMKELGVWEPYAVKVTACAFIPAFTRTCISNVHDLVHPLYAEQQAPRDKRDQGSFE